MPGPNPNSPWDSRLSPADALARWPDQQPLAVLWTAPDSQTDTPGYTILAKPSHYLTFQPGEKPRLPPKPTKTTGINHPTIPFQGGWIGLLSYDLARQLEPTVELDPYHPPHPPNQPSPARPKRASSDRGPLPIACWQRCDDAAIYDHTHNQWTLVGTPPTLNNTPSPATFRTAPPISDLGQSEYERRVAQITALIRAGDVYQVNLAHRLTLQFEGSPRAFFTRWAQTAKPWFGAYIETPEFTVASMSPELFLRFDPSTRTLTTRPMKGTRPASLAHELGTSPKDHAELAMIVDLMRNDLGKVSELGSIRVLRPRDLELHADGTLAQATATVQGTLRADLSILDALLAIFPAGSVTGAPKVRAMQIIDELEPTRRGPYCGSIGFISDSGHAAFNVAIRTAVIAQGRLDYHVGAGIVADSEPAAEWEETMEKAEILRGLGSSS
jgi:para-aminobenzoate synthetase component I